MVHRISDGEPKIQLDPTTWRRSTIRNVESRADACGRHERSSGGALKLSMSTSRRLQEAVKALSEKQPGKQPAKAESSLVAEHHFDEAG